MNAVVGDKYAGELLRLFESEGAGLFNGQHSLCLTVPCLQYLQRNFTALQDGSPSPVPQRFAGLQKLQECLAKIVALKLIADRQFPLSPSTTLNLALFKTLQTLTVKKVPLQLVTGLQRLRGHLKSLVVQRCQVEALEDVLVRCGGDDSTSFAWSCLKELDVSHNSVSQLGDSLQYLPALEQVNFSNNSISINTEGLEYIDNITFLHLGFNQLCAVPRFGSRAKYNLRLLNLRNNSLETLEGLQELDCLVEVDLTDNLISKHTALLPLRNLHHLATLILVGNPVSFHPKHRLKTSENLSNLINPTVFRLDGKKLSGAEKKAIPRSIPHFATVSSSGVVPLNTSRTPLRASSAIRTMPPPQMSPVSESETFFAASLPSSPQREGAIGKDIGGGKKRRGKKPAIRTVPLFSSDDSKMSFPESQNTSTSVPLVHENQLLKQEHLRMQLKEKWLLSTQSPDTSTDSVTQATKSPNKAEQQPIGSRKDRVVGMASQLDTQSRHNTCTDSSRSSADWSFSPPASTTKKAQRFFEGERDSSPGHASDDCFLVERYESDVEDEDEEGQVILTLSDRFLKEKSTNGETLACLDLHCLKAVSLERRPARGRFRKGAECEVLLLHFNVERRDRRKREYIFIEGNHHTILKVLNPIIDQNRTSISVTSEVECLSCQQIFDYSRALELPSDEPEPLSKSPSLSSHNRRSLSNRVCPNCGKQVLQYSVPKSAKAQSFSHGSTGSYSPHSSAVMVLNHADSPRTVAVSDTVVKSGFVVKDSSLSVPGSTQPELANGSVGDLDEYVDTSTADVSHEREEIDGFVGSDRHEDANPYAGDGYGGSSADYDHSYDRFSRHSDDVLYPNDSGDFESSRMSAGSREKHWYSHSSEGSGAEPACGSAQERPRQLQRGIASTKTTETLDDRMDPWKASKAPLLNPFDSVPEEASETSAASLDQPVPDMHERLEVCYEEPQLSEHSSLNPFDDDYFMTSDDRASPTDSHTSPTNGHTSSTDGHASPATVRTTTPHQSNADAVSLGLEMLERERDLETGLMLPSGYFGRSGEKLGDFPQELQLELSTSAPSRSGLKSMFTMSSNRKRNSMHTTSPAKLSVAGHRRVAGHHRSKSADSDAMKSIQARVGDTRQYTVDPGHARNSAAVSAESVHGQSHQLALHRSPLLSSQESMELPHGSRGDVAGYSSEERQSSHGYSSGERHSARGYSSGERRSAQGYSSGERRSTRSNSSRGRHSVQGYSSGERCSTQGNSSGERLAARAGEKHSTHRNTSGGRSSAQMYSSGERYVTRGHSSEQTTIAPGYSSGEKYTPQSFDTVDRVSARKYSFGEANSMLEKECRSTQGYSSGEKVNMQGHSSGERMNGQGYSSGERTSTRGYSSGEKKNTRSCSSDVKCHPRGTDSREYLGKECHSEVDEKKAHCSSERLAINRSPVAAKSVGTRSSSEQLNLKGYSSGEKSPSSSKRSLKNGRQSTSGSSDREPRHGRQSPQVLKNVRTSSSRASERAPFLSVLFKDDDPSYVHNSLNLHLNLEVFDTDSGEQFKMIFKSDVVCYGADEEVPALLVASNQKAYIYRITAPESPRPDKWLQLMCSHTLEQLTFIDIGVGYQFLRLEFTSPDACYTFLLGDEGKCQRCSTKLAYVVSDTPKPTFKSVGVCPFSVDAIKYPERPLREALMTKYDGLHRQQVEKSSRDDEDIVLYLLAHRYTPEREHAQYSVSLVITSDSIYLGRENFSQWPFPHVHDLPPRDSLRAPFIDVQENKINDVEQVILDRDQNSHVILRFFKENVPDGNSRSWILLLQSSASVTKLVRAIQEPWQAQFEMTLPIYYK